MEVHINELTPKLFLELYRTADNRSGRNSLTAHNCKFYRL